MQELGFIEYIGESVIILGHHNADPDAVGSAQGVKELIETLKPGVSTHIVMPDDISRLSRQIIEGLGLDIFEQYSDAFDTIIVVDSGGFNQLGEWEEIIKNHNQVVILIDHHTHDEELTKYLDFILHDNEASSTSEIVYRLYESYQIKPSSKTAKALLAGIAFDTKFFNIGDSSTYNTISNLLETIGDISLVLSLFRVETDISERIARLKTAQRAEIHRIRDWVIAISEVGSYQASGARALVGLGADLAIVLGVDQGEIRASMRSTQRFFDESGVHLGVLISSYSEEYGGSGSGHPTAAGYNGHDDADNFKKSLLGKLTEKIS